MADAEEFTEYGSVYVEPDGSRSGVTPLGRDRDYALGQYRAIAHGLEDTQWVVAFVSRRVTQTPWADADQP